MFCSTIAAIFIFQGIYFFTKEDNYFHLVFNFLIFVSLFLALFFARHRPNYRWLMTGLLIFKVIDVLVMEWAVAQEALFYLIVAIMDLSIILMVSNRALIVKWLARRRIPYISRWSRDCMGQFGFSTQELLLVAIYWLYVGISLLTFFEDLIYYYTDFSPAFFYAIYSPCKVVLNLIELLLIFSVACGHAKGVYSGRTIN